MGRIEPVARGQIRAAQEAEMAPHFTSAPSGWFNLPRTPPPERGRAYMKTTIMSRLRAWSLGVLPLLALAAGHSAARADIFFTEYGSTPALSTVNRINDAGATIWSRNVNLDSAT